MLLDATFPTFPTLMPDPIYSFYPYPVLARTKVHQTLLGESSSTSSTSIHDIRKSEASGTSGTSGSSLSVEQSKQSKEGKDRAGRRALMGRRPAGVALSREAEELSDEEAALEDEKQNINMFGHRFLLPFGRRHTQMEMDAAPSPTPSEPDHERRQEDQNMGSPTSPLVGGAANSEQGQLEEGGDGEVDLDASVEDLDAGEGGAGEGGDDLDSEEEGEDGMEEG